MDYVVTLFIFGVVVLLTTWLPLALKRIPLSLPICCIVIGILLSLSPFTPLPQRNPLENVGWAEHLTELVVIVALMGAGLKIDRPLGWRRWMVTWRLLGVAMPLSIGAIAFLGWALLSLPPASALLLGAALAPTDPVLAADVQVGPPQTGEEDDIRFALTSEAGLNDGLSFPFVMAAIAIAGASSQIDWIGHWLVVDVLWKLVAGTGMGWLAGRALAHLTFRLPKAGQLAKTGDGLAALGFTCVSYAATELVGGYGFVAVFISALTLRSVERGSTFHSELHDFGEQIERLLMMVLLVCFGAVLAEGTLLSQVDWRIVVVAVLTLAIIRPLAGWISLFGCHQPKAEKAIIAVFGIRGLGSIYYLAFATQRAKFEHIESLWATVFMIILISVIVHGIAVTPVMRWIDRERGVDSMRPMRGTRANE
ncbi:sodium/proton antiporter (CPA1 family) [Rhizobium sp. ERR 942]|uniref:cation:proton antiporter n=1 Tax=Rhizobium sp. ERR 942 TaxID=2572676 RepID=UPI0011A8F030|nr:cation:proton antiporter [Rhizobium sp. ERR 942]TWB88240.1 sodium/proton antiporter (CPA1 family) [Rhizobium sp. ERR 942]